MSAPVDRGSPAMTSVLIPARNASRTIERQLEALTEQRFEGAWEVIVSDNGSSDGTAGAARSFADRLPGLRVVDSSDRQGAGHARNVAARAARGDFLAFCDADDEVDPGWLHGLTQAGIHADLVGGVFDRGTLSGSSVRHRRNEQLQEGLPSLMGFFPFCSSGNFGIWAAVFEGLGGWNERYGYGEDVELVWRAQVQGHSLAYAPDALVRKRSRESLDELGRQAYRYGTSHVQLYRDFRDAGLARPSVGTALRQWAWLAVHVGDLRSPDRKGNWMWTAATRYGRLRGSIRHHVVCL